MCVPPSRCFICLESFWLRGNYMMTANPPSLNWNTYTISTYFLWRTINSVYAALRWSVVDLFSLFSWEVYIFAEREDSCKYRNFGIYSFEIEPNGEGFKLKMSKRKWFLSSSQVPKYIHRVFFHPNCQF